MPDATSALLDPASQGSRFYRNTKGCFYNADCWESTLPSKVNAATHSFHARIYNLLSCFERFHLHSFFWWARRLQIPLRQAVELSLSTCISSLWQDGQTNKWRESIFAPHTGNITKLNIIELWEEWLPDRILQSTVLAVPFHMKQEFPGTYDFPFCTQNPVSLLVRIFWEQPCHFLQDRSPLFVH